MKILLSSPPPIPIETRRTVRTLFACLLAAALFSSFPLMAQSEEISGEPTFVLMPGTETFEGKISELHFPTTITIESNTGHWKLKALGSGLRTKFRIKVYEGVLYADASAVLEGKPKELAHQTARAAHIEMHFRRDVGDDKIADAFRDGFNRTIPEEMADGLRADREQFLAGFDESFKKGDVVTLTWLPGVGLITRINDTQKPAIDNAHLATALFLIWIGDDPVSGGMKKDLFRLK